MIECGFPITRVFLGTISALEYAVLFGHKRSQDSTFGSGLSSAGKCCFGRRSSLSSVSLPSALSSVDSNSLPYFTGHELVASSSAFGCFTGSATSVASLIATPWLPAITKMVGSSALAGVTWASAGMAIFLPVHRQASLEQRKRHIFCSKWVEACLALLGARHRSVSVCR